MLYLSICKFKSRVSIFYKLTVPVDELLRVQLARLHLSGQLLFTANAKLGISLLSVP
jgi:hypothetical protein